MEENEVAPISAEEAEQYDRQIRLWGVEAQKKYVTFRTQVGLALLNASKRASLDCVMYLCMPVRICDIWNVVYY